MMESSMQRLKIGVISETLPSLNCISENCQSSQLP
jgi:hypothetical protein